MQQNPKKRRSALGNHSVLLVLVMAVTVVGIAVNTYAVFTIQNEVSQSARSVIQMRMDHVYSSFSTTSQSLKRILVEAGQMQELEKAQGKDVLTRIQTRAKLINRCAYISTDAGMEYCILFSFTKTGETLDAKNPSSTPLTQRRIINQSITRYLSGQSTTAAASDQWQIMELDGKYYALKAYFYQDVWICAWVPAEQLTAPLIKAFPEKDTFPVLITASGHIAVGSAEVQKEGFSTENITSTNELFWHKFKRWMVVESTSNFLGFRVRLFVKNYGRFEQVALVQTIAMLLIALVISIAITAMAYTQRKILRPLRRFTNGLKTYNPEAPLLPSMSNELQELAEASEMFNNLTKEISRLRIDAYENELTRQKTQMDYMQLQIKPHFYLNSLNLIHSMAQKKDTETIGTLSKFTAKYLRYIFQSDVDAVLLGQELEHIKDYLSIMEIRYSGNFSCEIVAGADVKGQYIPPLILHTFVENTLKHGIIPQKKLTICISALIEEEPLDDANDSQKTLCIFITDNGRGFSESCLNTWNAGQDLPRQKGSHIGIANATKRLQLAYNNTASLRLYNSPLGGAVVEMHLPYQKEDDLEPIDGG